MTIQAGSCFKHTPVRLPNFQGSFDICHVKDSAGNEFATRMSNVFVIGKGSKPMVSLPKAKGIKMTIVEEMEKRKEESA